MTTSVSTSRLRSPEVDLTTPVSGTNSTLISGKPRDEASQASSPQAYANSPAKRGAKPRAQKMVMSASTKPRVLVVDDVADVTEMLALFLKHAGYEVVTANSAASALQITSQRQFDLIISDIGMPEMNGYDLAASLRKSDSYRATPMIAVTGYTEYDDRGRSLDAGFNAHLTKPINPSRLLTLIGDLLA